jgi:hypothetical protein
MLHIRKYDLCISLGLFIWSTSCLPCVLLRAEEVQCWLIWTHDTFNINTLWAKLCSSGAGLQGSAVHLVTVLGCWIHNRYVRLTIIRSVSACLNVLWSTSLVAGVLLRTQEVSCRVWSILKEWRSIKLLAAIQEAKRSARSAEARFERALH